MFERTPFKKITSTGWKGGGGGGYLIWWVAVSKNGTMAVVYHQPKKESALDYSTISTPNQTIIRTKA